MPDDSTIKIDASGTISIPIDGATLKVDSTTGMLYADVISALAALSDVDISSASNGQALIYNSATSKWENSNVSASSVAYSNTSSGLSATNAQAAIDEVNGKVISIDDSTTVTTKVWSSNKTNTEISNVSTAQNNKHKVTSKQVATTGWTSDTTSQSGTTLYKKTIALSHVYVTSPIVDIGASGVLPTTAQQQAYDLLQYVTINGTTLTLYGSAIPTTAYYINITGVD